MGKGDKGAKIFKTKRGRGAVTAYEQSSARTDTRVDGVEAARDAAAVNLRTRAGAASATRSRPAARTSRARIYMVSSGERPARRRASASAAPCPGAA